MKNEKERKKGASDVDFSELRTGAEREIVVCGVVDTSSVKLMMTLFFLSFF